MTNRSGHPGIVLINNRKPFASLGTRNSSRVIYDSPARSGVTRELPVVEIGSYECPKPSMMRAARGAGINGAFLARFDDIVCSSKRVRNVIT